jgi:hypothetical protein
MTILGMVLPGLLKQANATCGRLTSVEPLGKGFTLDKLHHDDPYRPAHRCGVLVAGDATRVAMETFHPSTSKDGR